MSLRFSAAALLSIVSMGALVPVAASAETITVENFSFENPSLPVNTYQGDGTQGAANNIPGWTGGSSAGVQYFAPSAYGQSVPGTPLPGTADGLQAIYINGGSISQDVGALLANTTYTLTVAAGNQPGYGPGSTGTISLVDSSNTVLASDTFGQPALQTGNFTDFTAGFTSSSAVFGDLTIVLALASGSQVDFDNVRLNATAVPEPFTLALLGSGLFGLVAVRRRAR